jgi:endo-alpha-1,4-polygalactosaminidase (GH114 family)
LQLQSFLYQLQNLSVSQAAASPFDLIVSDYSLNGSTAGKFSDADVPTLHAGAHRHDH